MGNEVSYLYEPEGTELHWDGLKEAHKPSLQNASLSGPAPTYSSPVQRQGLAGTSPSPASYRPQPPPTHKMSPDDLLAQAKAMLESQELSNSHAMQAGPSTGARNDSGGKVPEWLRQEMEKKETDL